MSTRWRCGTAAGDTQVNFVTAMARVRHILSHLSAAESARRLRALGGELIFGEARFVDSQTVTVNRQLLRFRKAPVATGARPSVPLIPGMIRLGRMGANMAQRLLRGGHQVVGFDPRAEARAALEGPGAETADSLAALCNQFDGHEVHKG
ncbi:NAD(P)-binding domain-containing protein [Pseudomonas nitroreducens]|uniref:NAD(P)-binding domain-containing protein n=1 Tax=Pseudomonas nitroreducens TaxID=46680 RepID=UPI002F352BDB